MATCTTCTRPTPPRPTPSLPRSERNAHQQELIMRPNLLAPVLALAAIGCVSTGRYEDLKHRYDSARLELGRTRSENQGLRHQAIDREATLWGTRAKLRQE